MFGEDALYNNISRSGNVAIGNQAGLSETGSDKLYIENTSSTTPIVYGDFSTNEVGINWNPASALPNTLSVNGNASKSVSGSWLANSDARLKKEIKPMNSEGMLSKVLTMQDVSYK